MSRFTNFFRLLLLILVATIPLSLQAEIFDLAQGSANDQSISFVGEFADGLQFEWNTSSVEINQEDGSVVFALADKQLMTDDNERLGVSGLVRLPWGSTARLEITGGEVVPITLASGAGQAVSINEAPVNYEWANLGQAGILRDITVAPLSVNPVFEAEDGTIWVVKNLQMNVRPEGMMSNVSELDSERPVSPEFYNLYKSLVINELDDLGLRLARKKGSFLIFTHSGNVPRIRAFTDWKKQKGFNVVLHTFEESPNNEDLRTTIRDYYETLDPPLEYVLFIGDHNRGNDQIIPAYTRIQNPSAPEELDVTDWPYVYIDGDDYFPEVLIGRMPTGDLSEANKATIRVVNYEKTPFMVDNESRWTRALVVGANYAEGGRTPWTPVATSEWLYERLAHDWGMSNSDSVLWRADHPETGDISDIVNSGALFVTYRGWGNATGWLQPPFLSGAVDQLENVNQLPVLTSFVCNTGDFGENNHSKCFATHWITAGTPNNPSGSVTSVAPSDLHTKTKFNNPLSAGFYTGIYQENISNVSAALLRAKFETFYGHPNSRGEGDFVQFYFGVYHVIGDPTLSMWSARPKSFTALHDAEIPLGQNYTQVTITSGGRPLPMTYVNILQDNEIVDGCYTDQMGVANINLTNVVAGELEIVATRDKFRPYLSTINVTQEENQIGIVGWQVDPEGPVIPGNDYSIQITLENTGNNAINDVTATLSFPDEDLVDINRAEADFGNMASGAQSTNIAVPFEVTLNSMIEDAVELEFSVMIEGATGGPWTSKIWVPINALHLEYLEYSTGNNPFSPGNDTELNLTFDNLGSADAEGLTAILESWDESVTVVTANAALETIAAGSSGSTATPFSVSVNGATYASRIIRFTVTFMDGDDYVDAISFAIPLEGAQSSDPLGPDAYGYFAYDQTDASWFGNQDVLGALTYQWPDLENVAEASLEELVDDENFFEDIGFDFVFYGETFDRVTISSNGWLSFGEDGDFTKYFFRNWHMTAAIGAKNMVSAFWDDLKSEEGELIQVYTHNVDDKFIVEFSNCVNTYGYPNEYFPAEFAIILYDPEVYPTETGDGIIEIHYREAQNVDQTNNAATVGIENGDHTKGLTYTYAFAYPDAAAELGQESAIRFTTLTPDNFEPISIAEGSNLPEEFKLYPVYPNPFNSTTEFSFDIAQAGHVKLTVYNLLGQEVAKLVNRQMDPGHKMISFNVSDLSLSTGMLIYRLEAGSETAMGKMMYLK